MNECHHNCYRDSETGDLWCPAFGGWQDGGCPMKREDLDDDENENDNERNDDDE